MKLNAAKKNISTIAQDTFLFYITEQNCISNTKIMHVKDDDILICAYGNSGILIIGDVEPCEINKLACSRVSD
ncbi:hypothetical protein T08_170 [Trichinella sp. T8]|nr:hypothetical protein T08_170 [Trichinella sp. T8]